MTQPTIAQLRNLTDRAAHGLTADEQQRLREGIDALHAERADAWQKFATVAAQRDRLRIRMNALADQWEHALAPDKPYARTLRAEISIEPFSTDGAAVPDGMDTAEHAGLRDLITAALYERERPPNDPHWPDAYPMDREVFEPMADAVLAVILPATRITAALARMSDADVQRVIALYERWVKAGPPPLGVSMARWWDMRLAELHAALTKPAEPAP